MNCLLNGIKTYTFIRLFGGVQNLISIFMSYSHKDEDLRNQLETHLAMLKRDGVIDLWHDHRILPGDEFEKAISDALEGAQVIMLLVSPDFLDSDYCYDKELQRAMERHHSGEARVLPVILRHCDWHSASFGKLLATPPEGKPIMKWADIDEAFFRVTQDIRRAIEAIETGTTVGPTGTTRRSATPPTETLGHSDARSSNLRTRQTFTEADKDRFLDDAFEYMANFFENSLDELGTRNSDIETSYKRIDARRFTAVIYRNGNAESHCQIFHSSLRSTMAGISYSMSDSPNNNSFNENLSVEEGEQMLFLRPFGLGSWSGTEEGKHLTFEGAAEFYWSKFIGPLQR